MAKINKHIEIVSSTKRGLSSMGPKSCRGAQAVLAKRYTDVGITVVNDLADLQALVTRRPDVVFLGMKFIPSDPALGLDDPDKIWLNKYLTDRGILCTGSDYKAHEAELNKQLAKQCVLGVGLKTPKFYVAARANQLSSVDITLTYPVFIKPTDRGGGAGVDSASVAYDFGQLCSKVQALAANLDSDSLVEEYLSGREFSVGILRDAHTDTHWAMPIELIAPVDKFGERILSAQVKHADSERHVAVEDGALAAELNTLAIGVFHALGAREYGRIDIRLDGNGTPHFLEANLLPSLLDGYGNFPKACLLNRGISYDAIILGIVELALTRGAAFDDSLLPDDDAPLMPYGIALDPVYM